MDSSDRDTESRLRQQDEETDFGSDEDDADDGDETDSGLFARMQWLARTDEGWVVLVREVASSFAIVAVIGLVLFAVSGLWPPLVAVESESMAPNLQRGDLVFVMEEYRFAGGAARNGTGVVPYQAGAAVGYKEFNKFGDVIVYKKNGNGRETPIIHRTRFWVSKGENWYDEANQDYLSGANNCEDLTNCPAEHAGFITKGDNNARYDQVGIDPISEPVKPSWIIGTAEFRIPWLGRIRLLFGMVD